MAFDAGRLQCCVHLGDRLAGLRFSIVQVGLEDFPRFFVVHITLQQAPHGPREIGLRHFPRRPAAEPLLLLPALKRGVADRFELAGFVPTRPFVGVGDFGCEVGHHDGVLDDA